MNASSNLEAILKELEDVVAEEEANPTPDAGQDLPDYDPLPEAEDDVAVTFVKKSDAGN